MMSNSGNPELVPTAPPGPQPNSGYPPAGAMAPVGMVAAHGASGGAANAAYVPVNNEKRPAAVIEHAASQMAPAFVSPPAGTAAGDQQPYGAPPSYSQTVQPGGYPQPQLGYQQYPPQQGYQPQGAYPQAAYPQGTYTTGGYQAPPQHPQQVPAVEPKNVAYGATAAPSYPIIAHPQTSVVMSPSSGQIPAKINDWDKGLCSCFSNCGLCLLSSFFPCYVVGKNAEALGHSCCLYGVGSIIPIIRCIAHVLLRTEIRNRRGIKGSEFGDFCSVCFCSCCALIQEGHEVRLMENQDIQRE